MRIGIIGGIGRIGSSLGRAWIETGRCAAQEVVILKRADRQGEFCGHPAGWANCVADLVNRSDLIIISVRPQDWAGLRQDAQEKPVTSVMAGVHLQAMPNAATELRKSCTPWFAGPDAPEAVQRDAVGFLSVMRAGEALQSEHHLDLMISCGRNWPGLSGADGQSDD